jgi:hypothetical protein
MDRRELLKLTGIAAVGGIATVPTAGRASSTTTGETLFAEDFTARAVGSVPDEFTLVGSERQNVTETNAAVGEKAYRMEGGHDDCQRATVRIPLAVEEKMTITGNYRREDGQTGCHEGSGSIRLGTTASSSQADELTTELVQFYPDGRIEAQGTLLGIYETDDWMKFTAEYSRDVDEGTVTYNVGINDSNLFSVTRDEHEYESELSALELTNDDHTVYWDDITVQSGLASAQAPDFELSVDVPDSADPRETISVETTIENLTRESQAGVIEVSIDGERRHNREITVWALEQQERSFFVTVPSAAGAYPITVTIGENTITETITVEPVDVDEPFGIVDVSPSTARVYSTAEKTTVTSTIFNTAGIEQSENIALSVDGDVVTEFDLQLGAYEERSRQLSFETPRSPGEYEYELTTDHDSHLGTIVVMSDPERFEIIQFTVPKQLFERESFEFEAVVENGTTSQQMEAITVTAGWNGTEKTLFEDVVRLSADGRTEFDRTVEAPAVNQQTDIALTITVGEATQATETVRIEPNQRDDVVDDKTTTTTESTESEGGDQSEQSNQPAEKESEEATEPETIDIEVPGFTIPGTVAALGGAGYMLRNRLQNEDNT